MGRWEDAIPAFQKALQLQASAETYSNLGTAYFFLKRNDEAIQIFEKAVQLTPKDETAMGNLADAYRAGGRVQEADATYGKAIQLAFQQLQVNPKLASATSDVALYYAKKGDVPAALQYIRQARALDPSDLQLLYDQARFMRWRGNQKGALASLREALQKGYSSEEATNDPELANLKSSPEFTEASGPVSRRRIRQAAGQLTPLNHEADPNQQREFEENSTLLPGSGVLIALPSPSKSSGRPMLPGHPVRNAR